MAFDNSYSAVTGATYAASDYNTYVKGNFTAIWVGTTAGDMDYYSSATAKTRLAAGSAYKTLRMNSSGNAPEWGGYIAGKALRTTTQSINNLTSTNIQFDSCSPSVLVTWSGGDNTKLVLGVAGLYIIGAYISVDGGTGYREATIKKNGTALADANTRDSTADGETTYFTLTSMGTFAVNDYLQLEFYHSNGSAIDVRLARLWAVFIGV